MFYLGDSAHLVSALLMAPSLIGWRLQGVAFSLYSGMDLKTGPALSWLLLFSFSPPSMTLHIPRARTGSRKVDILPSLSALYMRILYRTTYKDPNYGLCCGVAFVRNMAILLIPVVVFADPVSYCILFWSTKHVLLSEAFSVCYLPWLLELLLLLVLVHFPSS